MYCFMFPLVQVSNHTDRPKQCAKYMSADRVCLVIMKKILLYFLVNTIVFLKHTIVKCLILYILKYLQYFVNECYSIM